MKAKDLKPAHYNPRTITPEKLKMLGQAMQEFGDLSGVVVNVRTGNVIGGHQRIKHFDPDWPIVKKPITDDTGTTAMGHIQTPLCYNRAMRWIDGWLRWWRNRWTCPT